MLSVAIDTSVYKADARRSKPAFRALTRLIKGHEAELAIPHFVKREFVTKQQETIGKALKAIADGASTIFKNTNNDALTKYACEALERATQQQQIFAHLVEAEFDAWVVEIHAEEYPITVEQAQGAAEDYFAGNPPFKVAKSRNDIPDGFIWRSILDIARESGRLHFITSDDTLFSAASGHSNIVPHRKLDDFIQTSECQAAIKNLWSEILEENIERAHQLLRARETQITERITTLLPNALTAKNVYDELLPTDDHEAVIYDVGSISSIRLSFDDISYYGENEIGIPFDAKIDCTLEYALYKGEYYRLSHDETKYLRVENRNEHYFGIEDDRTIEASGVLTLRLCDGRIGDITLDDTDLERLLSQAEYSIEVPEIEIE